MSKGTHISKKASRRIQCRLRDQDSYRNAWNVSMREQYKGKNPMSRPEIWFTKTQEAKIRAFVKDGDILAAQVEIINGLAYIHD